MTEWLLSGHNTQETSGVTHPLTETIDITGLNDELIWSTEKLAGGTKGFDLSLLPAVAVQGRIYLNVNYFVRNVALAMPFDPESIGAPKGIIEAIHPTSLGHQLKLPWRIYSLYRWGKKFYQCDMPNITKIGRELYHKLRSAKEPPLAEIEEFFETERFDYIYLTATGHIVASLLVTMVDSIVREKRPELLGLFVGNRTATSMMAERIWELRGVAQQCGPVVTDKLKRGIADLEVYRQIPEASPFVAGVEDFLRQYGHRGFRHETDLGAERLDDRPEHVVLAIAGQLEVPIPPPERAKAAHEQAEMALRKLPVPERVFWNKFLGWGRELISWRENSKSMLAMRQAIIALSAKHLARHYYPDLPEDTLLFHTQEEFLAFVRSKGQVAVPEETLARRRSEYELHLTQAPPPELIWYDPETHHWRSAEESYPNEPSGATADETPYQFQGIPVSAGSGAVEGVALVTNDPVKAGRRLLELQGNVILVTRFTDPAWSGLFGRLTGVVTELGGVISHAAIIAREHGLPAVVGVTDILNWVHDGQRIRIDGRKGTVEILE